MNPYCLARPDFSLTFFQASPETPTFGQVLQRSKIFSVVAEADIEAEKFFQRSAEFFVEKNRNFDLSDRDVSAVLAKSEELFPIEKVG